ncbi:uncharacterized protein LY89DRAFT_80828 [Mollisia scopiformis]|uniref:Secreted protein n=1 Tax=Mollisia scopiformis TaxID=149040 RepID=A0A194X869_MOLSC|nr:uncharacterized protein LY89DRAFT_80828 [Mollisia scopiformis]KUJ16361.1 hypothetical protein LY89DRAFT_80828 [Mollisia scopiformis]
MIIRLVCFWSLRYAILSLLRCSPLSYYDEKSFLFDLDAEAIPEEKMSSVFGDTMRPGHRYNRWYFRQFGAPYPTPNSTDCDIGLSILSIRDLGR